VEDGALTRVAVNIDAAAVAFHDAVHHRQPEAGTHAHGLGGEEGIKDALLRGLVHATTVVADRHPQVAARLQVRNQRGVVAVQGHSFPSRSRSPPAVTDGVGGIGGEIHP
jgi:hypothetical protein